MLGLMQDRQLLISSLIEYAAKYHGDREIVSRTVEGPIHRYTYRDANLRAKQLANALVRLGVKLGDRVATLAWNGYRHFELYFGVSGLGAVLHTVNPRLFPDQVDYIINHAEDTYVFVDLTFVPLLEGLAPKLKSVKGYIVLTDEAHMPKTSLPNAMCYETLIGKESTEFAWPSFDENTASSLCYTSGTTGNPKGVLYSHRSTMIHTFAVCTRDVLGISSHETILVIVPLFHANAWGIAYGAAMTGAKLLFPGQHLDGKNVYELIEDEGCTMSAGVPTVWLMLFGYLDQSGKKITRMKRCIIGGSAAPRSMCERFERDYGCRVIHAWGMTEMSPLGTTGVLSVEQEKLPLEKRLDIQQKQGRVVYGVEMKIVDDDGKRLPEDGKAFGRLMVRGPWITRGYFKREDEAILDDEGYFDTGDVSTIDPHGWMQITDRAKDVIKSGGEWISSIDLENEAVGHPAVAEAAVIGVPHEKWQERPLLIVVKKKDKDVSRDELLSYLSSRVAKWWMPDDVVFVNELPHTATGKLLKTKLRQDFKGYRLPGQAAE